MSHKIMCVFTHKERPFCWGRGGGSGFCKFLQTPNIVTGKGWRQKVYFTCSIENEKLHNIPIDKECTLYTSTLSTATKRKKVLRRKKLGFGGKYAETLRKIKTERRNEAVSERKRYEKPTTPFVVGEAVVLYSKNPSRNIGEFLGVVKKVNIKTYTIEDEHKGRYRIDKISLSGLPTYLLDGYGVTEKMKIGEDVYLKKVVSKP